MSLATYNTNPVRSIIPYVRVPELYRNRLDLRLIKIQRELSSKMTFGTPPNSPERNNCSSFHLNPTFDPLSLLCDYDFEAILPEPSHNEDSMEVTETDSAHFNLNQTNKRTRDAYFECTNKLQKV